MKDKPIIQDENILHEFLDKMRNQDNNISKCLYNEYLKIANV